MPTRAVFQQKKNLEKNVEMLVGIPRNIAILLRYRQYCQYRYFIGSYWICKTEIANLSNSRIRVYCTNELANFSEMAIQHANWPIRWFLSCLNCIVLFQYKYYFPKVVITIYILYILLCHNHLLNVLYLLCVLLVFFREATGYNCYILGH